MDCPLCGDHCCCTSTAPGDGNSASSLPHAENSAACAPKSLLPPDYVPRRLAVGQSFAASDVNSQDWRNEVSSRVNAHRAKRRKRNGEDTTMSFGFDEPAAHFASQDLLPPPQPAHTETAWEDWPSGSGRIDDSFTQVAAEPSDAVTEEMFDPQPRIVERHLERKQKRRLIEFPRPAATEAFAYDLAEPVIETPRIFEAPEAEPEASAVAAAQPIATVHLDAEGDPLWTRNYDEADSDLSLEVPLPVAPLAQRTRAAAIDSALVLAAGAGFLLVVYAIVHQLPQGRFGLASLALVPAVLWALYQYMFLVFAGATPGMRMAQLELCNFDGAFPLRTARKSRVAALALSCASLGLGFAWVFVDEDSLGWHDRITRTYLRLA